MNNPKEIILHCAATPEGQNFTAADIEKWHKQRGFKKIGYHYVIDLDGKIEKGRDEKESGAHCVNHNSKSIGINYIGGLAKDGKTPKDTRTPQQKESMYKLVDDVMTRYNIPLSSVHGHYEFANKACPSFKMETFRKEFNEWKKNQDKPSTNILLTNKVNNGWFGKILSFIMQIINLINKSK